MNQDYISYFNSMGIQQNFTSYMVACEICEHESFATLVNEVEIHDGYFSDMPVVTCKLCGFIMQNPRFNKEFYDHYYNHHYRLFLAGDINPRQDFIVDQLKRGKYLFRYLADQLPRKGRLLDVGCSAGGIMAEFAKHGWEVFGIDPDLAGAKFGREYFKLPIEAIAAEEMILPENHYDLIIITGSLEHVYDVNKILTLCRRACSATGLLLIEGRAFNFGIQRGFFSHNHRRYLTEKSISLLMHKHGWDPLWVTNSPICGPTRPGGVYALGKAVQIQPSSFLYDKIANDHRDDFSQLKMRLGTIRGIYLEEHNL